MQLWCLGSALSSPVGSGAKPQPTNDLVHIWAKRAALVASFVDFAKMCAKDNHDTIYAAIALYSMLTGAWSAIKLVKLMAVGLRQAWIQKARLGGEGWGGEGFEAPKPKGNRQPSPKRLKGAEPRRHRRRQGLGIRVPIADGLGDYVVWEASWAPLAGYGAATAEYGFQCVPKFASVTECLSLRCLS